MEKKKTEEKKMNNHRLNKKKYMSHVMLIQELRFVRKNKKNEPLPI